MICKECGADLAEAAVFCDQCGTRVAALDGSRKETTRDRFLDLAATRQRDSDRVENKVWQGKYSMLAMFGWWITAAVATIVLLIVAAVFSITGVAWLAVGGVIVVMWLVLALLLLYRQLTIHYYLTDQRIIHETGLLWRTVDRIELIDVDDVTFQQGPIERMLGVGNVRIASSDSTHPEFDIKGIDNVRQVADRIDELRRAERRRRGLHIESI